MIDQSRLAYLFQKFVASRDMNDEEIDQLTLEEMSYIYAAAEVGKKDVKFKDNNLPIRQQIFYWRVVNLLKEADSLYIVYLSGMNYPYQDLGRNVWFFSTEEIARRVADDVKAKRKITLQVRRVDKSMLQPMFMQLYYCGVEGVLLDQGAHPMPVKRSDLFDMPPEGDNPGQRQIVNGKLQSAMIQFFQLVRTPEMENRSKLLPAMETNLMVQLMNAKFLIPMQLYKNGALIRPGVQMTDTSGVERRLANLKDNKEGSEWLPVFTDWPEFGRTFKTTEWGAAVVDYKQMMKVAGDTSKNIVINPKGCGFRINEQVKEQLKRFEPRKEEIERALTDQEAAKALAEKMRKEAEQKKAAQADSAKEEPVFAASPVAGNEQPQEPAVYQRLEDFPDLLGSVLKKTAKASRIVKRMWLLERIAGKTKGYLAVVDTDEDIEDLKEDMKDAAEDYLGEEVLEIRKADDETDELTDGLKPFYKKGFFG